MTTVAWPVEWDTLEGFLAWCKERNVKGSYEGKTPESCLVARAVQLFQDDPSATCGIMSAGGRGTRHKLTQTAVQEFDARRLPEFGGGR